MTIEKGVIERGEGSATTIVVVATLVILNSIDLPRFWGGGAQLYQIVLKAIFTVGVALLLVGKSNLSNVSFWSNTRLTVAYIVVALISGLWATDLYSWVSAIASLSTVICVFVLVAQSQNPDYILWRGLQYGFIATLALSFFALIAAKESTYDFSDNEWRFSGITYGAHSIARIGLFCVAGFVLTRNRLKGLRLSFGGAGTTLICVAAVAVIFMADSRQAMIGLLLIPSFLVGRVSLRLAIIASGAVFGVVVAGLFPEILGAVGVAFTRNSINDVLTLSSRTVVWEYIIAWNPHPLVGIGFGQTAYFLDAAQLNASGWTTPSAHNAFLQSWLELGLVGVCLISLLTILGFSRSFFIREPFFAFATLMVVVLGFVEQGIGGAPDYLLLVLLYGVYSSKRIKVKLGP